MTRSSGKTKSRWVQTNMRLSRAHRSWLDVKAKAVSRLTGERIRRSAVVRKLIDDARETEEAELMSRPLASDDGPSALKTGSPE